METERIVFKTVERTLELACGAAHPLLGALRRLAAHDKPSALRLLRDILHARSFVAIREAYAHSPALRKPGSDGQTGSSYELNDWHEALCRVLSPCDDTEVVREKLADAIWQIQQNQLARATLIPLLLQQVYDTAPTAALLQAELCAFIKSFEKPAYLNCVDCKARRLVWRYPVPPPGQFRCGHGCCLFPGRACSKGGWLEHIDVEALFPATLFSVVAACEAAVKERAQEEAVYSVAAPCGARYDAGGTVWEARPVAREPAHRYDDGPILSAAGRVAPGDGGARGVPREAAVPQRGGSGPMHVRVAEPGLLGAEGRRPALALQPLRSAPIAGGGSQQPPPMLRLQRLPGAPHAVPQPPAQTVQQLQRLPPPRQPPFPEDPIYQGLVAQDSYGSEHEQSPRLGRAPRATPAGPAHSNEAQEEDEDQAMEALLAANPGLMEKLHAEAMSMVRKHLRQAVQGTRSHATDAPGQQQQQQEHDRGQGQEQEPAEQSAQRRQQLLQLLEQQLKQRQPVPHPPGHTLEQPPVPHPLQQARALQGPEQRPQVLPQSLGPAPQQPRRQATARHGDRAAEERTLCLDLDSPMGRQLVLHGRDLSPVAGGSPYSTSASRYGRQQQEQHAVGPQPVLNPSLLHAARDQGHFVSLQQQQRQQQQHEPQARPPMLHGEQFLPHARRPQQPAFADQSQPRELPRRQEHQHEESLLQEPLLQPPLQDLPSRAPLPRTQPPLGTLTAGQPQLQQRSHPSHQAQAQLEASFLARGHVPQHLPLPRESVVVHQPPSVLPLTGQPQSLSSLPAETAVRAEAEHLRSGVGYGGRGTEPVHYPLPPAAEERLQPAGPWVAQRVVGELRASGGSWDGDLQPPEVRREQMHLQGQRTVLQRPQRRPSEELQVGGEGPQWREPGLAGEGQQGVLRTRGGQQAMVEGPSPRREQPQQQQQQALQRSAGGLAPRDVMQQPGGLLEGRRGVAQEMAGDPPAQAASVRGAQDTARHALAAVDAQAAAEPSTAGIKRSASDLGAGVRSSDNGSPVEERPPKRGLKGQPAAAARAFGSGSSAADPDVPSAAERQAAESQVTTRGAASARAKRLAKMQQLQQQRAQRGQAGQQHHGSEGQEQSPTAPDAQQAGTPSPPSHSQGPTATQQLQHEATPAPHVAEGRMLGIPLRLANIGPHTKVISLGTGNLAPGSARPQPTAQQDGEPDGASNEGWADTQAPDESMPKNAEELQQMLLSQLFPGRHGRSQNQEALDEPPARAIPERSLRSSLQQQPQQSRRPQAQARPAGAQATMSVDSPSSGRSAGLEALAFAAEVMEEEGGAAQEAGRRSAVARGRGRGRGRGRSQSRGRQGRGRSRVRGRRGTDVEYSGDEDVSALGDGEAMADVGPTQQQRLVGHIAQSAAPGRVGGLDVRGPAAAAAGVLSSGLEVLAVAAEYLADGPSPANPRAAATSGSAGGPTVMPRGRRPAVDEPPGPAAQGPQMRVRVPVSVAPEGFLKFLPVFGAPVVPGGGIIMLPHAPRRSASARVTRGRSAADQESGVAEAAATALAPVPEELPAGRELHPSESEPPLAAAGAVGGEAGEAGAVGAELQQLQQQGRRRPPQSRRKLMDASQLDSQTEAQQELLLALPSSPRSRVQRRLAGRSAIPPGQPSQAQAALPQRPHARVRLQQQNQPAALRLQPRGRVQGQQQPREQPLEAQQAHPERSTYQEEPGDQLEPQGLQQVQHLQGKATQPLGAPWGRLSPQLRSLLKERQLLLKLQQEEELRRQPQQGPHGQASGAQRGQAALPALRRRQPPTVRQGLGLGSQRAVRVPPRRGPMEAQPHLTKQQLRAGPHSSMSQVRQQQQRLQRRHALQLLRKPIQKMVRRKASGQLPSAEGQQQQRQHRTALHRVTRMLQQQQQMRFRLEKQREAELRAQQAQAGEDPVPRDPRLAAGAQAEAQARALVQPNVRPSGSTLAGSHSDQQQQQAPTVPCRRGREQTPLQQAAAPSSAPPGPQRTASGQQQQDSAPAAHLSRSRRRQLRKLLLPLLRSVQLAATAKLADADPAAAAGACEAHKAAAAAAAAAAGSGLGQLRAPAPEEVELLQRKGVRVLPRDPDTSTGGLDVVLLPDGRVVMPLPPDLSSLGSRQARPTSSQSAPSGRPMVLKMAGPADNPTPVLVPKESRRKQPAAERRPTGTAAAASSQAAAHLLALPPAVRARLVVLLHAAGVPLPDSVKARLLMPPPPPRSSQPQQQQQQQQQQGGTDLQRQERARRAWQEQVEQLRLQEQKAEQARQQRFKRQQLQHIVKQQKLQKHYQSLMRQRMHVFVSPEQRQLLNLELRQTEQRLVREQQQQQEQLLQEQRRQELRKEQQRQQELQEHEERKQLLLQQLQEQTREEQQRQEPPPPQKLLLQVLRRQLQRRFIRQYIQQRQKRPKAKPVPRLHPLELVRQQQLVVHQGRSHQPDGVIQGKVAQAQARASGKQVQRLAALRERRRRRLEQARQEAQQKRLRLLKLLRPLQKLVRRLPGLRAYLDEKVRVSRVQEGREQHVQGRPSDLPPPPNERQHERQRQQREQQQHWEPQRDGQQQQQLSGEEEEVEEDFMAMPPAVQPELVISPLPGSPLSVMGHRVLRFFDGRVVMVDLMAPQRPPVLAAMAAAAARTAPAALRTAGSAVGRDLLLPQRALVSHFGDLPQLAPPPATGPGSMPPPPRRPPAWATAPRSAVGGRSSRQPFRGLQRTVLTAPARRANGEAPAVLHQSKSAPATAGRERMQGRPLRRLVQPASVPSATAGPVSGSQRGTEEPVLLPPPTRGAGSMRPPPPCLPGKAAAPLLASAQQPQQQQNAQQATALPTPATGPGSMPPPPPRPPRRVAAPPLALGASGQQQPQQQEQQEAAVLPPASGSGGMLPPPLRRLSAAGGSAGVQQQRGQPTALLRPRTGGPVSAGQPSVAAPKPARPSSGRTLRGPSPTNAARPSTAPGATAHKAACPGPKIAGRDTVLGLGAVHRATPRPGKVVTDFRMMYLEPLSVTPEQLGINTKTLTRVEVGPGVAAFPRNRLRTEWTISLRTAVGWDGPGVWPCGSLWPIPPRRAAAAGPSGGAGPAGRHEADAAWGITGKRSRSELSPGVGEEAAADAAAGAGPSGEAAAAAAVPWGATAAGVGAGGASGGFLDAGGRAAAEQGSGHGQASAALGKATPEGMVVTGAVPPAGAGVGTGAERVAGGGAPIGAVVAAGRSVVASLAGEAGTAAGLGPGAGGTRQHEDLAAGAAALGAGATAGQGAVAGGTGAKSAGVAHGMGVGAWASSAGAADVPSTGPRAGGMATAGLGVRSGMAAGAGPGATAGWGGAGDAGVKGIGGGRGGSVAGRALVGAPHMAEPDSDPWIGIPPQAPAAPQARASVYRGARSRMPQGQGQAWDSAGEL